MPLRRKNHNRDIRSWAFTFDSISIQGFGEIHLLVPTEPNVREPHTIIGGARELLSAGMWLLALLVFLAGIGVPCLKLVGLVLLLVTIDPGLRAVAFAGVVIRTMFTAQSFDPRLMRDAALLRYGGRSVSWEPSTCQ